jgi:hypothetical protein
MFINNQAGLFQKIRLWFPFANLYLKIRKWHKYIIRNMPQKIAMNAKMAAAESWAKFRSLANSSHSVRKPPGRRSAGPPGWQPFADYDVPFLRTCIIPLKMTGQSR